MPDFLAAHPVTFIAALLGGTLFIWATAPVWLAILFGLLGLAALFSPAAGYVAILIAVVVGARIAGNKIIITIHGNNYGPIIVDQSKGE